ncbi:hypothetical protein D9M70_610140 [compost metagenome]
MEATAYTAIEDDGYALVYYLGNRRQYFEGRRTAVQLTASMVGYPDRRCARFDSLIGVFGELYTFGDGRQP